MNKQITDILKVMSPEELAVKLGVSASSVFKWKSGKVNPSRLAKEKIEKVYLGLTKKRI